MSEVELAQLEEIEKIISRKIKPIYWLMVALVTIFAGITAPSTSELIRISVRQSSKMDADEAYQNFMTKSFYHQLQKDEHISDVEAIQNPGNAANIYMRHNSAEGDRLDIKFRGK